jgi:hypothetical protein
MGEVARLRGQVIDGHRRRRPLRGGWLLATRPHPSSRPRMGLLEGGTQPLVRHMGIHLGGGQ